tara:strand:- start:29 stop:289 length:261 start_codon:yes stop_codon:yes gene_type:complete
VEEGDGVINLKIFDPFVLNERLWRKWYHIYFLGGSGKLNTMTMKDVYEHLNRISTCINLSGWREDLTVNLKGAVIIGAKRRRTRKD